MQVTSPSSAVGTPTRGGVGGGVPSMTTEDEEAEDRGEAGDDSTISDSDIGENRGGDDEMDDDVDDDVDDER